MFKDFKDLSQEKRYEASKHLRGLILALEQKTEECQHLRWTLRERAVQLEQMESERERMIVGLRQVKFDREMRRKRLRALRQKMKERWIEREMKSERYVSFLLKCCCTLKYSDDIMDVMTLMIEKLKCVRDERRKSRRRIML